MTEKEDTAAAAGTDDAAPTLRTREIFAKMDDNHDGVLSKDEFIKGCMDDETLFKLLACTTSEDTVSPVDKSL